MKKIIINDHNLTEEEMELKVIRVKGLIINSIGKILIAHNNDTYQFPGGHKEDNETINECIIREIKDETGIDLTIEEEPFLCIKTYDNNYFGTSLTLTRQTLFIDNGLYTGAVKYMKSWNNVSGPAFAVESPQ